jgi:hypothetical protein
MRTRKAFSLATAVAMVSLGVGALSAAPAYAAVPTNDTIATATEMTGVPFTDTVDTTEATTDSLETSLNADCGAPVVDHGVWYHATVAADGLYTADVSQSSFGAGIMVIVGPANNPTVLNCGPGSVTGPLTAGDDIFLLIFGDGTTLETSGTMVLTVDLAPPPPTVNLTINPRGRVAHGVIEVSGTITCTGAVADFSEVFGFVQQSVGRLLLSGFFDAFPDVQCDGTAHAWQGLATADNGRFGGGKADVFALAEVCHGDSCGSAIASATLQLSGRRS